MKKKTKKYSEKIEHRGNDTELLKNFEMQMKMIHSIKEAGTHYSDKGDMKKFV